MSQRARFEAEQRVPEAGSAAKREGERGAFFPMRRKKKQDGDDRRPLIEEARKRSLGLCFAPSSPRGHQLRTP